MKSLNISLIDLNPLSRSRPVQQLMAIFENEKVGVRLMDASELQALAPASNAMHDRLFESVPDVIFLIMTKTISEAVLTMIRNINSDTKRIPIIAVLEDSEPSDMVEFFRIGITDFITPPFRDVDVMPRVWKLTEHIRKEESLTGRLKRTLGLNQLVGESPLFMAELEKIPLIARCDSSVLISGETGTGKEMFARAIHYLGPRAGKPFIPVNCGAIPTELIENELFGHTKGAFTSAATAQDGIISEVDGGTLFLDEIDCLSLSAQVKLLRFLQEKEYRQLGSAKTMRADVRVVAATNIDLEEALQRGGFRKDLYYRLNIIPLTLPPLRERNEDTPLLARHFVDQYALEFRKEIDGITPEAMQKMLLYDWPGNVRELQNVIERAVVFSSGRILQKDDINLPQTEASPAVGPLQQAKARVIMEFEKKYIHNLLAVHRGNITHAARTAGKNRRAFWELVRKYQIDVESFKLPLSNHRI
jgi:two-component system response regulator GlrR